MNKEEKVVWNKKYYMEHKEELKLYYKEYYLKNREKNKLRSREYYQKHKEKWIGYLKNYKGDYKRDPMVHLNCTKEWKKNNKEKVSMHNKKRFLLIKMATGSHSQEDFRKLKESVKYTCPCCGKSEPEIRLVRDHIIPITKGGSNEIENIQPLCNRCNCKKYTKIINIEK